MNPFSQSPVVPTLVDACSLISLLAAGGSEPIRYLAQLGQPLGVVPKVRRESHFVWSEGDQGHLIRKPIDLSEMISEGWIQLIHLSSTERALSVGLSGPMDDGEAESCAVASIRNWGLLTDDTSAIKYMSTLDPPAYLVTTPEVLKQWFDSQGANDLVMSEILHRVERYASFRVPRHHPLRSWWLTLVQRWNVKA